MQVPENPAERHDFYLDLMQRCRATVATRREFYQQMRAYYLFGCNDRALNQVARVNKILPHLDQLGSLVFSPETTRFTIELGPSVNAEEQDKVPPLTERLQMEWNRAAIDQQFKQAVRWSGPYGKVHLKFRPRVYRRINEAKQIEEGVQLQAFLVEPHNFGVLREDKARLNQQEAFCEEFSISRSELRNNLIGAGKKPSEVEDILARVQAGKSDDAMASAAPIDRIIVTAVQGDAVMGNAPVFSMPLSTLYRPSTKVDLVHAYELYVYDDAIADYRIVTYLEPDIPVFDRPLEKMFLPHRLPYVEVCLNPAYDYYWGYSEVERLIPLQDLRNERLADILHLLRKQAHPPHAVMGTNAIPDEMALALDTPDGLLSIDSPAAKLDTVAPDLPADLWHDIEVIDEMFNEISGLPAVIQGKHPPGARSEAQQAQIATLASTRIKDRSLTVEDSLDECAMVMVELMKRYDKRAMREESENGAIFMAHQFPEDYAAKVDGHSNSPIFVENHEQKVFALADRKIIDGEEVLDLIEIPQRAALKKRLREKIEPAEAAAHKEEMDLKRASIAAKRSHGGKGPPVGNVTPLAGGGNAA